MDRALTAFVTGVEAGAFSGWHAPPGTCNTKLGSRQQCTMKWALFPFVTLIYMADECLDLSQALKSSEENQGGSWAGGRQLESLHHAYSFCGDWTS